MHPFIYITDMYYFIDVYKCEIPIDSKIICKGDFFYDCRIRYMDKTGKIRLHINPSVLYKHR